MVKTMYLDEKFVDGLKENLQPGSFHYIFGSMGAGKSILINELMKKNPSKSISLCITEEPTFENVKKTLLETVALGEQQILYYFVEDIDYWLRNESEESFHHLISEIFPQIYHENPDAVIVTTGYVRNLPWRIFDIRSRLKGNQHKMPPVDKYKITQWVTKSGISYTSAMEKSLGYPKLLSYLEETPEQNLTSLAKRFFEEYFVDLNQEGKEFILKSSIFPVFNVPILQNNIDNFKNYSVSDYYDKINQMLAYGLIEWDQNIGGYNFFDNRVRRIIEECFKDKYPDLFIEQQSKASIEFQQESKYPTYLRFTFLSAIYHTAITAGLRIGNDWQAGKYLEQINEEVLTWINNKMENWRRANWEEIHEIWETSAGDPFLRQYIEEILSAETFEKISELIAPENHV